VRPVPASRPVHVGLRAGMSRGCLNGEAGAQKPEVICSTSTRELA
jgi:hypothetical protein